jgi:hypothetical protein
MPPSRKNSQVPERKVAPLAPHEKLLKLLHLKGEVADKVRRELPRQVHTDSWGKRYIFKPNVDDLQEIFAFFTGKGGQDDEYGVQVIRGLPFRQFYSGHGAVTAATAKRLMKNPSACFLVTWPDKESSTLVTFYIFNADARGTETLIKASSRDERKLRTNSKFGRNTEEDTDDADDTDDTDDTDAA